MVSIEEVAKENVRYEDGLFIIANCNIIFSKKEYDSFVSELDKDLRGKFNITKEVKNEKAK